MISRNSLSDTSTSFGLNGLQKAAIEIGFFDRGAFTNYVYKRRWVDGQKNRLFVNHYTIDNVNEGG